MRKCGICARAIAFRAYVIFCGESIAKIQDWICHSEVEGFRY